MSIVVTALLSSASTAGAIYLLWRTVLVPDLEKRAQAFAKQATADAGTHWTGAGQALADQVMANAKEELSASGRELAAQATADASTELTAAGEALVPQFRKAIRDGIQDAFLTPPTDRLGQTARGVTTTGLNVMENSLRRVFGLAADRGERAPEDNT